MNKLITIALALLIGLAMLPIIDNLVTDTQTTPYEITFTMTDADGITHDLSDDDFDYILDNIDSITNATTLNDVDADPQPYLSAGTISILFAEDELVGTLQLDFVAVDRSITDANGDLLIAVGEQDLTVYFDIPVDSVLITLTDLLPIVFVVILVTGTVLYIKSKQN
jgi:hypothetical protein